MTGTVRFDIADGERTEHWYLQIHKGEVTVSHDDAAADCVLAPTSPRSTPSLPAG